jgi:predicted MFS family arabinose efflux permease
VIERNQEVVMATASTAARPRAGDEVRQAPARPGWVLAALLGAMFLGNIDVAVANIAGPSIRAGLHASGGELELVVSGYTLAYATLLVTCARLGEARGYRPMFLAGLGLFIAASLACGLAPDALALVVARIVAGGAAALMTAQVLTGIQLGFQGRARARALGLYSLVLSAGAVAGQSLGGLLISADVLGTTWRPAFLVNVPIGIAVFCLAWRCLPAGTRRPQPLDLAGVAALGAAMVLLVLPLMLGEDAGWPPWTWACLAASGLAFAALYLVERRVSGRGGHPLVDLQLLARPAIAWGLAAQAVATATYFAVLFTLALYLQEGLGKSAAYSGLALVSWVAAFGVPGPVLGRAAARLRSLAAPAGPVILAAGFAGLAASLRAGDTNGALLMALLGVAGLGLGTGFTGVLSHLTGSVGEEHAADISGLFGTITRASGLIGTAVFGTVYLALARDPGREQAIHAFAVVNLALAITALAAAALAGLAIRFR